MVDRVMLREMNIDLAEVDREVEAVMAAAGQEISVAIDESVKNFETGTILKGRVLGLAGDDVIIDVGYKSEGAVPAHEFDNPKALEPGTEVEVLLDAIEDDAGLIVLSKRKADRIRGWEKVIAEHDEGDVVKGRVMRKIKGGLLVDIGVPVFLPASQVDIRRPSDIGEYVDNVIECKILKIDERRNNIVVSRRRLIEEQREAMKSQLMADIEVGQTRKGQVKNIADFGAFVDLGGIDGLLHITDMSWGRVSHPSEVVALDQEIEVRILNVDRDRERIALGLKQKSENPWKRVPEKYPVGSRVRGEVVNVTNYGAFVKLEEGVEGLVHVSEMSWTRHINHPSEVVAIGDVVEVVVLNINEEKEEISLGMKQTESNPWDQVEDKYPVGTRVTGRVRNLASYGAFIELEEGIDGLLHISDMSWTKKITHPSEVVRKGDRVEAVVLNVSQERKRVALGLKQLSPNPWQDDIPAKYRVGDLVKGKVTKLTSFGAFVELEAELEGLLHVSEIADQKVAKPEDVLGVGQEVEVYIIRVEADEQKIGLSLRQNEEFQEQIADKLAQMDEEGELPAPPADAGDVTEEAIAEVGEATEEAAPETPEKTAEAPAEVIEETAPTDTAESEVEADPAADAETDAKDASAAPPAEDTEEDAADGEEAKA